MEFYFPAEFGERVAFVCAAVTAVIGLLVFLFPGTMLRLSAFQIGEVLPEGYAAARGAGAHHVGLGVLPILFQQDWLYFALGTAMAFAAGGRLVSCLLDRGLTFRNILFFLFQVALGGGPLAYYLGYL